MPDYYDWTRVFWWWFHHSASKYPEHPTADQKRRMKTFVELIPQHLICGICNYHFAQHQKSNPIENSLASRHQLELYFYKLHNEVNQRNKKMSLVTFPEMTQYFRNSETEPLPPSMNLFHVQGNTDNIAHIFFWMCNVVAVHINKTSIELNKQFKDWIEAAFLTIPPLSADLYVKWNTLGAPFIENISEPYQIRDWLYEFQKFYHEQTKPKDIPKDGFPSKENMTAWFDSYQMWEYRYPFPIKPRILQNAKIESFESYDKNIKNINTVTLVLAIILPISILTVVLAGIGIRELVKRKQALAKIKNSIKPV